MDISQYRDLFISESRGHIQAITGLIVRLEDNGYDAGCVDDLFRHAHSLKGMAATMEINAVANLAHRMEDLLSPVRSGECPFSPLIADLLLEGSDTLSGMIDAVENGAAELPEPHDLLQRLSAFDPTAASASGSPDSGRPASSPADGIPPVFSSPLKQPKAGHSFRHSDSFKSVRVRTETLDRLINITGELITTRHRLADVTSGMDAPHLQEPLKQLTVLIRELRDEVFQARMLPFSFVAERFPRLVRDLARAQGKEIALRIKGREIELDRGILEEIAEPLVHILRNAVDHGMETPAERTATGKRAAGEITITVSRDKDHVEIAVADDGRGMSPHLLAEQAVAQGLIGRNEADALTPREKLLLTCLPGFSTAKTISDISGRGVGMDAVKNTVQSLSGSLAIESEPGSGSRIVLRLPVTVSIIPALLVRCGALTVALPVNAVSRTIELKRSDLFDDNGHLAFMLDNATIPLKSLHAAFGQKPSRGTEGLLPVVISEVGGAPVGIMTDALMGQQEIFVKPLGTPLSRLRGITGGAVTGDGSIVFVADLGAIG